ncbi:SDR family NAD(P)-dependent oxidoreductase [Micromonospora radicis]|uniref:SDR family oxidoreductase n=1 Tax=Micromonospora radicis TaxID=1894971 RepID=A0A418MQ31_9ACTN|nr:SDR family oxidoreductase [Micromonospora radicis]RIV34638.1 SDR family oxidoreductase [Micromonospora radicis]
MTTTPLLEGKVAFITGGASGMGRACALTFAADGARVVVVDLNEKGLEETVALVEAQGGEAASIVCDVSSEESVKAAIDFTIERFGRLDGAVNSAGIDSKMHPFAEIPTDEWNRNLGVNLTGLAFCVRYEIERMLEVGGGSIVNIASVAGLIGVPGMADYTAAKHGVVGLTKAAAADYARQNVRINVICPGVIATAMMAEHFQASPELEAVYRKSNPMHRWGTPEEIADAAAWLLSARSSYVTAQAIAVDGGANSTGGY